MSSAELIYFGEPGSFTHLVAKKIPNLAGMKFISRKTVPEVFEYVQAKPGRRGLVPIENSSGGMIVSTVDQLLNDELKLQIQGEYALNVRLALLGRKGEAIRKIYSHFVPFFHCKAWLEESYPKAKQLVKESTSAAAKFAAQEPHAAAIAPFRAAATYKLDVIHFPIGENLPNLTQFFLLGHPRTASRRSEATSLALILKNEVGSLHYFLKPFAMNRINIKRIISRNIIGQPNNYVFFISADASIHDKTLKETLKAAKKHCSDLRVLGSYPVLSPFES